MCLDYVGRLPAVAAGENAGATSMWNAHAPSFEYAARYVGRDDATSGSWRGRYGRSGHYLLNASRAADGSGGTEDVSALPSYVRVEAPALVDTRGAPTSYARGACQPDGPFATHAERIGEASGRAFGNCAFVWPAQPSDPRLPQFATADAEGVPRVAGAASANGWKGSFHFDVRIDAATAPAGPFNVSLYVLDFARWGARAVIKLTDRESQDTLSEAALAEGCGNGTYFTFRVPSARSLRFRIHQAHAPSRDRDVWAPPPLLSAVFIDFDAAMAERATPAARPEAAATRPNLVLFLADDLDHTLGSVGRALPQTRRLLAEGGARATNWYVHTPICCPSRAELLAGRFFHNLRVAHHNDPGGCMQANLTKIYDDGYFANAFAALGYTVGVFGKHLNNGNPPRAPQGVDRWLVNGGGEDLDPTFSFASAGTAGETVKFDNCSGPCYSTAVIGNATLDWIRAVRGASETPPPFFAYVAVKAPHIQDGPGWPVAIPAPWHDADRSFGGVIAPRTPNYNASCPAHHWLIRSQPPMTTEQADKADALYRSRLGSLLAVDDTVGEVVGALGALGVLEQTFVAFTSDHGFRFGQFSMPQGKWNAYENDLRIPFYIRGPGITAGSVFDGLASNVDVMPTLLELVGGGGAARPAAWDGRSAAAHLLGRATLSSWRTDLLIEYFSGGEVVRYEHLEDAHNNSFRMLRRLDPAAPAGWTNLSFAQFVGPENWDFEAPVPPAETELFHLDSDPFQLHNALGEASGAQREELQQALGRLFRCKGAACG